VAGSRWKKERTVTTFEFTIAVLGLDLDSEFHNAGLECLDYVAVAGRTAGIVQVDVEITSESAASAVERAVGDLLGLNVTPRRIELDLVNTSDIAERLGKNRETVRLWAQGERRGGFPAAYAIISASPVWAWADVHEWAVQTGLLVDGAVPVPVTVAEAFTGSFAQFVLTGGR